MSSLDGKDDHWYLSSDGEIIGRSKNRGGIVIDNVTVNLTIENVNVGYGTDIIDDAAGILLKREKAKIKILTVQRGKNSFSGVHTAVLELGVEKDATLVITEQSTGT